MNSSTHPGGCHQFSFHKEHSSNILRTSEASSETIYVMILVVEIQYQVGILPAGKKKKKSWSGPPPPLPHTCFQAWMAVTLRWLRREQEQTCWKKQLSCDYDLGENNEFIRVVLHRPNNCCLPLMCSLLNDQLFPKLPMSRYEWDC